jgi:hypothetical protein
MLRVSLALASLLAALPAAAQDYGGISLRGPTALLTQIDSNRGCPMSETSVTFGVNRAFGAASSARQQLGTMQGAPSGGCRPLVSTQVVGGFNLALGRASNAGQAVQAQGPAGVLATTTYTRGANIGYGAGSVANQRLTNQITR